MKFAQRIEKLQPYLFVEISRKINEKRAAGINVITFAIGDPDIPTPPRSNTSSLIPLSARSSIKALAA